ncbi:MAG TPA: hypothetical protein VJA46_05910 [Acidimicrobiia bacterium]|nr:hypothetical protein [Acidimicrobiia bacterium]
MIVAWVVVAVPATPAVANHECYFDSDLGLVCEDHGEGGGEGSATSYWTTWQIVGQCGGGGVVGGGLIDINSGLVLALRDQIMDGEVVETQTQCIDLDEAENTIWEAIASAVRALPDPRWESNPDTSVSVGLTGLETWLWYSNPSQVGPIDAIWVEPVTGIEFGVRGRGWTESVTWDTGEASYQVFAAVWDDAPSMGGSPESPAARHVYNTSSTAAGYNAGYPVSLDLLWVGEYQVMVVGGVWTTWARFASTLAENVPNTYEVVEVRSRLSG